MTRLALIVEDELPLRELYESVLSKLGFEIIHAADGVEAIDILTNYSPDIVFLDMLLPRVDGRQVLDYIQSTPHLADTVTVVVTAHSRYRNLLPLTPQDQFLLKPIRPHDIQAAVQRVLATH